ncbi:MAG: 3-deoxy-7-phosphoheptulonate synthase [Verrucomicrobia bacterium]|nr:3-deoxy-7-phosphoheptulonate synthase [Verrucomicrobiota bacterium]MBV9673333.1 3-deoxy-7-phosphoheptulonate synthase [Verrucomicrobiota bacterium]
MIIVTRPDATEAQIERIVSRIQSWGLKAEVSRGAMRVVIGVIGPEDKIREKPLGAFPGVESVTPVLKPYKLVAYEFRGMPSKVNIGNVTVGEKELVIMAGPCSVESEDQIASIAKAISKAGAKILRGGAFKPRTSPYSFQGLGKVGLQLLAEARKLTGMPIITEVMDTKDLELVAAYADCLQIGARNMQNFSLLREVGRTNLPVMLKRGMSATIKDLLMSAEYILSEGNFQVLLCERGIRTFETMTRNTLDLNAVPVLKSETHLPIVVDPTHGVGVKQFIPTMALAAVAAGADSIMIEVHNAPELAKSDGEQSLLPEEFKDLVPRIRAVADAVGRELC